MSIKLKKEILNNLYAILALSVIGLLHPFVSQFIPAFLNDLSYSRPDFKLSIVGGFALWRAVTMICTKPIDAESSYAKVHRKRILYFLFAIVAAAIWGMKWEIDYPMYPELQVMPTFLGIGTDILGYSSYGIVILISFFCIRYIKKIEPDLEPLVDETAEESLSENPLDLQTEVQDAKTDA